jgi:hypothetical protein
MLTLWKQQAFCDMVYSMKRYKVTCLKCGGSNYVIIYPAAAGQYVIDLNSDHFKSNNVVIISGRYRQDMKFGWECGVCQNTSLLAKQELPQVNQLIVNGAQEAIGRVVESLKEEDDDKFKMEEA